MLHAQINRKCSTTEDILTSTFFGHLELLGDPIWLIDILETFSQKEKRNHSLFGDLDGVIDELDKNTKLSFEFWPKMTDGTEPDLIVICEIDDITIPIMFEVKYQSRLSNNDQLILEYKNLKNKRNRILEEIDYEKGLLVYLTKNKISHTKEFKDSIKEIKNQGAYDKSFTCIHLKWEEHMYRSLEKCTIEEGLKNIAKKLRNYLDHLGLVPFDGFDEVLETDVHQDQYYRFVITLKWPERKINPKLRWRFRK